MKKLITLSLVAAVGVGAFVAVSSAGQRNTMKPDGKAVMLPTGQMVAPYGFETLQNSSIPTKIAFVENSGFVYCMTATNVGPGQWTVSGTVDIGPGLCACQFWILNGTITQVTGGFQVQWSVVNCAPDGCTSCSSCWISTGNWTRARGNGGWTSYCQTDCTSTIQSGTWSGVITPPQC